MRKLLLVVCGLILGFPIQAHAEGVIRKYIHQGLAVRSAEQPPAPPAPSYPDYCGMASHGEKQFLTCSRAVSVAGMKRSLGRQVQMHQFLLPTAVPWVDFLELKAGDSDQASVVLAATSAGNAVLAGCERLAIVALSDPNRWKLRVSAVYDLSRPVVSANLGPIFRVHVDHVDNPEDFSCELVGVTDTP